MIGVLELPLFAVLVWVEFTVYLLPENVKAMKLMVNIQRDEVAALGIVERDRGAIDSSQVFFRDTSVSIYHRQSGLQDAWAWLQGLDAYISGAPAKHCEARLWVHLRRGSNRLGRC